MIEPFPEIITPLGHRGTARLRPSLDYDACWLAFRV
jgi:hypothetical protein